MRLSIVVTVLLTAAPAALSQETQLGSVGLTVFTEPDFRGRSATFREDMPNLLESGLNDRIVSVRVGRGEQWEVCEHARYKGRCVVLSGQETDLSQNGWSHTISSVRRIRGREVYQAEEAERGGLVLFARPGFSGERRRVQAAIADLSEVGFDDRTMSVRVGRGESWDVCAETRFRDCETVSDDQRDLRDIRLQRRISSVRPRY